MSERKVLQHYYPPDFDPRAIQRTRGPKPTGPKRTLIRLMAPYSMRCTSCGNYIYKSTTFNARKETADEKYLNITIFRFYIRCPRCSAEITFKTDPKNMDYTPERGATRNFEVWRNKSEAEETDEQRLDRLEREEAEEVEDAMQELEGKNLSAEKEMQIKDALDQIRIRNERREVVGAGAGEGAAVRDEKDLERERLEKEDEEKAKAAFRGGTGERIRRIEEEDPATETSEPVEVIKPVPFKKKARPKKDFSAALGIKKKAS